MKSGHVSLEEQFWSKVDKRSDEECWPWLGACMTRGYGQIGRRISSNKRVAVGAHRVSWELHFGAIPGGLEVCHHCDNKVCVNPSHLFVATHQVNVWDYHIKKQGSFNPLLTRK